MKFNLQYPEDEARRVLPRIAYIVDSHWKYIKFPGEGNNIIGKWNYLSPTDEKWEEREYNIFFIKKGMFDANNYAKVNFKTSDVIAINTNSNSEKIPTQIIINLKNSISVWITGGNKEVLDVCINS